MTTVLDTRSVPSIHRKNYWSGGIAEHFFPMRIETVGAPSFEARLASGQIGPVGVRFIQGRPHRVARTSAMITSADPECILLYLLIRGLVHLEQDGRSCILHPGDLACQDTSRPSTFESHNDFEVLIFSIPKRSLGTQIGKITNRTAVSVVKTERALPLLAAPFLINLARAATMSEELHSRDSHGAAEMILAMFHSIYDDEECLDIHSDSEVLLAKMQQYALNHLHEPELGPERIAQAHFVSTRYVHKLFASSGNKVSAWIRDHRLEGALRELQDSPDPTIAIIATRWGYRNPGSFSRAFREKYGYAPRDARHLLSPRK